jgi:hypothetical protein
MCGKVFAKINGALERLLTNRALKSSLNVDIPVVTVAKKGHINTQFSQIHQIFTHLPSAFLFGATFPQI